MPLDQHKVEGLTSLHLLSKPEARRLEVLVVDGMEADGTLVVVLFAEREVLQHACPTVDVATPCDARSDGLAQADGTRGVF